MRIRVIAGAAVWLAAAPVFAQSAHVTGSKTLTPPMVMCTDLPVTAKPVPRIYIKGSHGTDGRTAMTGGTIVVNRGPDDGLAVGQQYIAHRLLGGDRLFPRAGEGFGDVRITGWVTITAIDEFNALAEINFACDTVETGDYLEPYVALTLPTEASPDEKPDFSDRANVIFGVDHRVLFGDGDVFSIDRGTVQGVVPGQRYAIYRDFRDGVLPLTPVGEAVAMSVGETTTKVVITSTRDGVQEGDIAVPRRKH